MKRARDEIQRALKIKPNAHFGREKYQLAVMDWVVASKTIKTSDTLANFLAQRFQYDSGYDTSRAPLQNARKEAAQGLSGLIVLGAAWQSPDVFDALATALEARPTIALSYLARHRSQELLGSGAKSLLPGSILPMVEFWLRDTREFGLNDTNTKTLDAFYPKMRAEAASWNASRTSWMNARFADNKHPDTNTDFWGGWNDPGAPPSLDVAWFNDRQNTQRLINNSLLLLKLIVFGVPTLLIGGLLWFVRRRSKRNASLV